MELTGFELQDAFVVAELGELCSLLDPVPPGLVDRIAFALELESGDCAILSSREELTAGVRGGETRTITFDSAGLSVMIDIAGTPAGAVRVDGWLAPPGAHLVELRNPHGTRTARADDDGRFVLDEVPRGLCQIVVRAAAGGEPLALTPAIML
ncbi:hypothetical protein Aph01nite_49920 [Acrocarpospora phusangensis]|uniref:Carboxypeptidase regulatory-like domain-containing protein n=1 Tax=Acrocarpospora phusangensis TaxID=1070424 RepID=A0A919QI84_9ACTN|nr:hypothetical protein Aph01nite_49920 [Acrocarpospora phusangensis]